ncbi:hypothetical protein ABFS82_07G009900 [Erythranthe guttata]
MTNPFLCLSPHSQILQSLLNPFVSLNNHSILSRSTIFLYADHHSPSSISSPVEKGKHPKALSFQIRRRRPQGNLCNSHRTPLRHATLVVRRYRCPSLEPLAIFERKP